MTSLTDSRMKRKDMLMLIFLIKDLLYIFLPLLTFAIDVKMIMHCYVLVLFLICLYLLLLLSTLGKVFNNDSRMIAS